METEIASCLKRVIAAAANGESGPVPSGPRVRLQGLRRGVYADFTFFSLRSH